MSLPMQEIFEDIFPNRLELHEQAQQETEGYVKAICCSCQTVQQAYRTLGKPHLMAKHIFPGTNEQCDGYNTVPQCLVKED